MPARDIFHQIARNALVKDGWTITADPLFLKWDDKDKLYVDLAAEKLLAAEKGTEKIAVEVKTFAGKSKLEDLHQAVGQFLVYRVALREQEPDRVLFLAVPMEIVRQVFEKPKGGLLVADVGLKVIGFDVETEEIVTWKK